VLLRMKEVNRLRVLEGYMDGKIDMEEAARILRRTPKTVYRKEFIDLRQKINSIP
jgi:hypothetical protein